MKINIYKSRGTIIFGFFLLFLILAPVVFAASSDFLARATEAYQRFCTRRNVSLQNAISCYAFDKLSEIDELLGTLGSRLDLTENDNATQSAKLAELEQRIATLEGSTPPTSCIEPPSNLISWWPADGNANDIVGSNEGTTNNGAGFVGGKVGQAFNFDGVDDFIQASTSGLPTGNSDRTLDLWVKINEFLADVPDSSSPLETFFAGYGNFGSSGQIYALGTAGNVLYFSQWGTALFGPSLQTDKWYHVAVTNVGNFATLYLDGSVVASSTLGINTSVDTSFYMGRAPDSFGDIRRLNGLVDEVEVFNRALTPSEIQAIFEAGSEGKCKPYVRLFDDFDGTTLDADRWEFFSTNGGNYSFNNGSIVVSGGASMFFIRTKNNPFPTSGPFTTEFGIQYTVVDESGVGVALGFEQQNGYDQLNIPVSYWQDHNGLVVSRFGLTVATMSGVDTNYHIGKIVYDGNQYQVYLDGVLKYTSPTSVIAKSLWFGNPFCCRTNWTGFKLDYVKVTKP